MLEKNSNLSLFILDRCKYQGIREWATASNKSLLFDPAASGLPLLETSNGPLMREIYRDNGSGWIKIGVVRDPITRLLSAYLDLAREWRAVGWTCTSSHGDSPPNTFWGALQAIMCLRDENVPPTPTLVDVVEVLGTHMWSSPTAFHPMSSLCGAQFSLFDSVVPFEDLQVTEVVVAA